MYYVYILENSVGRLYIGQTFNLQERLHRHNTGRVPSTRGKGPWKLLHSEKYPTRKEAVQSESYLKSLKSKHYIKEYIIHWGVAKR